MGLLTALAVSFVPARPHQIARCGHGWHPTSPGPGWYAGPEGLAFTTATVLGSELPSLHAQGHTLVEPPAQFPSGHGPGANRSCPQLSLPRDMVPVESHMKSRPGELSGAWALRLERPNTPSTLAATLVYYYK